MDDQDWEPVVLRAKNNSINNNNNKNQTNIRNRQNVPYSLQTQIQQARQSLNMTLKQLASACNLPESLVRDYEEGIVIPKNHILVKMSEVLGVVLKNV